MKNYAFPKLLINSMFTLEPFPTVRFGRFHGNEIFIVRLIFWLCSASVFLSQVLSFIIKSLSHTHCFARHTSKLAITRPLDASTQRHQQSLVELLYGRKKKTFFHCKNYWTPGRCHHIEFLKHTLPGQRKTQVWEPHCASKCLTC